MSKITSRHRLRSRDARRLMAEFSERLGIDVAGFLGPNPKVELAQTREWEIYIINGAPSMIKREDLLIPALTFDEALQHLPGVIVDMGAVPHICNGADVMAPGVKGVEGEFPEGSLVVIVDERHGKPLAVGVALRSSEEIRKLKRGRVVRNLHYVGDKIWNLIKGLS